MPIDFSIESLKRGRDALDSGDWDYAFTVTDFAAPIFRSFQQTAEGGIEMFFPEHFATRSVRKTCPLRYMTQGNSIGDGLMHGYRANAFLIGTRSQY